MSLIFGGKAAESETCFNKKSNSYVHCYPASNIHYLDSLISFKCTLPSASLLVFNEKENSLNQVIPILDPGPAFVIPADSSVTLESLGIHYLI